MEDREIVRMIINVGCGGCCALFFVVGNKILILYNKIKSCVKLIT